MTPIALDNLHPFSSGPATLTAGPLKLRAALHQPIAHQGAVVALPGRHARKLTQHGQLIADDPHALQQLVNAVEALVDGTPRTLVDAHGHAFDAVLMTSFETQPVESLGPRVQRAYTVGYLQLVP